MHPETLLGALIFVVVAYVSRVLYRETTSPLRDVPGPQVARFTRLWYLRSIFNGNAQWDNIALHRKYADRGTCYASVVRLGPNMFSISKPDKAVYGIGSKMPKSSWYEGWKHPSPARWNIFADRDFQRHAETRRKFQNMYSLSSLLHYENFVDDSLEVFRQRLHELCQANLVVDIHHWLQCYAFDVIGCITFGKRFGFLDAGQDIAGAMAALQATMVYSTLVGVYAWIHPLLYRILESIPGSGAAGRSYLQRVVQQRLDERDGARRDEKAASDADGGPRDFLDKTLDAERDGEKGMTKYNVFMVCFSNIIAGSDTTAISLSSILWHLTKDRNVLNKLRRELDQAIAEGRMTRERVSFKESQNLPYLQACIKEGLRMCPATGLPLWRTVPKGGAEIMGRFFPEGSEVGINTWVAHYDEDIWGADALLFRPERWLEASPERAKVLESNYMPFGQGSRTCLGRHISHLEISKVVPIVVSRFDLELVPPQETLKTENFWFVKPTAFKAFVRPREEV